MGWLHDGHRSLMQRARADNATTIATIFVNPRQFNEAAVRVPDPQALNQNGEGLPLAVLSCLPNSGRWRRRAMP